MSCSHSAVSKTGVCKKRSLNCSAFRKTADWRHKSARFVEDLLSFSTRSQFSKRTIFDLCQVEARFKKLMKLIYKMKTMMIQELQYFEKYEPATMKNPELIYLRQNEAECAFKFQIAHDQPQSR
jgi:hypothetical protein